MKETTKIMLCVNLSVLRERQTDKREREIKKKRERNKEKERDKLKRQADGKAEMVAYRLAFLKN